MHIANKPDSHAYIETMKVTNNNRTTVLHGASKATSLRYRTPVARFTIAQGLKFGSRMFPDERLSGFVCSSIHAIASWSSTQDTKPRNCYVAYT